jgi:hypothetical protein
MAKAAIAADASSLRCLPLMIVSIWKQFDRIVTWQPSSCSCLILLVCGSPFARMLR